MKEEIKNFVAWYIKGNYHCDRCPYCWEERGLEDANAGCYIKGELCDTCRLFPPFKSVIGRLKKNRVNYWENRRYDGVEEWYSEQWEKKQKLRQILEAFLSRYDESGSTDVHDFVDSEMYDVMEELTKLAPPTPMKLTIKQKWNELFRETGAHVKASVEQFFCK